MRELLRAIRDTGLRAGEGGISAKRLRLTNTLAIVMSSFAVPYLVFYAFTGQWWPLFFFNLIYILTCAAIVFLNHLGLRLSAQAFFLMMTNTLVLAGCAIVGREIGVQQGFFVLVCLPLVLVDFKHRLLIASMMGLAIACYVAVEGLPFFEGFVGEDVLLVGRMGEGFVISLILASLVYLMRASNERYEKELEGMLRQISNQQAAMVNASKMSALGEMAAGIAHEINNPLAVIQLRAGLIGNMAEESPISTNDLKSHVSAIELTVLRISKIVQGLRSFARDAVGEPLRAKKISILVQETLGLCSERMSSQGVRVEVAPIPERFQAECRDVQVSQILLNLLNNAFDAVKGQPEKWIRVEAHDLGPRVAISVTDSGPGIPPGIRDKVFQPFFTTKLVGQGTGLGLGISKGLAESQGGSLNFDFSSPRTKCLLTLKKAT